MVVCIALLQLPHVLFSLIFRNVDLGDCFCPWVKEPVQICTIQSINTFKIIDNTDKVAT